MRPVLVETGSTRTITPVSPVTPPECIAPAPVILVSPPNGSEVQFPTVALLFTTILDVEIHYTLDGSEPTIDSPLYTNGVIIPDQNYTLRAKGFPTNNCPAGPTLVANWTLVTDELFDFSYLCGEADNTGRFPELDPPGFDPNGDPADAQWRLVFAPASTIEIVRLEVYQTDSAGRWNTGQAWSTDAYVYPYQDKPGQSFHCYPLVIKSEPGAVQLFNSYQTTLGNYIAANYEWILWGQREALVDGFFTLKVFLGDGRVIYRILEATCTPPPPPCGNPEAPIVTSDCTPKVDISGVTPSPNQIYTIYRRSTGCGQNAWVAIVTGTSDGANSYSYQDTNVVNCCLYDYYVSVLCLPVTYKASPIASKRVPCVGTVDIDANRTIGCVGDGYLLTWSSEGCDTVEIDNGIGPVSASGTLVVNPAVTTTYIITCNNALCGNATASVTITIVAGQGCGCWPDNQNATIPDSVIVRWTDETNINRSVLLINRGYKYPVGHPLAGKYRIDSTLRYTIVTPADALWPSHLELIDILVTPCMCRNGGYQPDGTCAWYTAYADYRGILPDYWGSTLHGSETPIGSYGMVRFPSRASNVVVS